MSRNARYKHVMKLDMLDPSNREADTFWSIADGITHSSGTGRDIVAVAVKGSKWAMGKNYLTREARSMSDLYPDGCGVHAELDLWHSGVSLGRSTVYVAGIAENSGNALQSTMPCCYCSAILFQANVKKVVAMHLGNLYSVKTRELVRPLKL